MGPARREMSRREPQTQMRRRSAWPASRGADMMWSCSWDRRLALLQGVGQRLPAPQALRRRRAQGCPAPCGRCARLSRPGRSGRTAAASNRCTLAREEGHMRAPRRPAWPACTARAPRPAPASGSSSAARPATSRSPRGGRSLCGGSGRSANCPSHWCAGLKVAFRGAGLSG
jgi:hypothetical protein